MSREKLYELVGSIREEFILEAEPRRIAALTATASVTAVKPTSPARGHLYTVPAHKIVSGQRPTPAKKWLTAACLALAILLLGGSGVGALVTVGGLGQAEGGITALFGQGFLPGLFPFLSPDESDTEPPYEVSVRDPEEITEPLDTRTECQKGNHAWELTDAGDATCYRAGTLTYGCALCAETRTEVGRLPHAYEEGACSVCGLVEGAWENTAFSRAYNEDGKLYAIINKVEGSPEGLLILPNVYYDEIMEQLIPVTEIGKSALMGLDKITEVVIPDTVTHIYEYAFKGCGALERVSFPEGLISIRDEAFNECKALLEAHLPDSVTELGRYVFMNCTSLVSATLPASFDGVPCSMYANCKSLTDVTLKGTIKTVGDGAFMGCSSLKRLPDMPELEVIGDGAFESCFALTEVTLPATLRELGHQAFASCNALERVTIQANSLSGLYGRVFWGCSSLRELTLPKLVGSFSGEEMLNQCNGNILTIYYPGTREEWKQNYGLRGLDLPINTKVVFMEEPTA